jgi:hypothetical protein
MTDFDHAKICLPLGITTKSDFCFHTTKTRTRHRSGRNPAAHRSFADLQQLADESSEAPARPNAHGWVRHFALRVCEAPHTLARGYRASARNTPAIAGGGQE